jgi:hypothetical protein
MNILSILYWVILVVAAIFNLYPAFTIHGLAALALFAIIGIKVFPLPVS